MKKIFLMHRILIIVILLSIFTGYIFSEEQKYQEKIETEGTLETWAWANKQNKLALLIENKGHTVTKVIRACILCRTSVIMMM